jgi:hypothetical protein
MNEAVVAKAEDWAVRWANLVLSPKAAFSAQREEHLSAFQFYLGAQMGAYLGFLLTCISFFVIRYRSAFVAHIKESGSALLAVATAGYAVFAIASLFALLFVATLSYFGYRVAASKATFRSHLRANFELCFLDPIAVLIMTLLILSAPNEMSGDPSPWILAFVVVFVVARAWYLYAAFVAMQTVHSLPRNRALAVFIAGYVPSYVLFNVAVGFIVWVAIALAVSAGD